MYYLPVSQDSLPFHSFREQESRLGGFHQPVQGIQMNSFNLLFTFANPGTHSFGEGVRRVCVCVCREGLLM